MHVTIRIFPVCFNKEGNGGGRRHLARGPGASSGEGCGLLQKLDISHGWVSLHVISISNIFGQYQNDNLGFVINQDESLCLPFQSKQHGVTFDLTPRDQVNAQGKQSKQCIVFELQ